MSSSFPNDPRKNPGIKRAYYPLPVEDPDAWRCIEIHIPDGEEYHELLITALKSLTIWFNYSRDVTHRGKIIADRFAYALNLPELGCDMNCEELTACLQPFFDALTASQDAQTAALQALIDQTTQALIANSAQPQSQASDCDDAENIYAGCLRLTDKMDEDNNKLYTAAEDLPADNAEEWAGIIVSFFPGFAGLPFGVLLELGNQFFSTQASDYSDGYAPVREEMAFKLYCLITANNCTLDQNVIGAWLDALPGQFPANKAAEVFGRYAPTRITFLNQIAAFFNKNQSLESYFADLITAYNFGHENTAEIPGGFDCDDTLVAENVGVIFQCGEGVLATFPFESGVAFTVPSIQQDADHWQLALRLPVGVWSVEVSSITGTEGVGGGEPDESAWGYIDPDGDWHNALWMDDALPSTFGTHDTIRGVYSIWCTTQDWNVYLNNGFDFSAEFIITAVP